MLLDLWGLTADEAIGKTMAELDYPKEVEEKLLEGVRKVYETGEPVENETLYTAPDGRARLS